MVWKHRKSWKHRLVIFSSCLILGAALTISSHSLAQPAQSLPKNIRSCMPTQTRIPTQRTEVVGHNKLKGTQYYLLATFGPKETIPTDLVVAVTEGQCKKLLFNPAGERVSLAAFVPQPVARHLTLARYQRAMQQLGGKTKLQQSVNESAQQSLPKWFEEEIWALQQLGITVPKNVKIQ